MLDAKADRLDYGTLLQPPQDFELNHALCGTYSLDLVTVLAALFPLGLRGDAENDLLKNPVFMLNAVQKLSKKIDIFCDASAIGLPPVKSNKLISFFDQMVHPINVPNGAFHPKFWLLEYRKAGSNEYKYRFIVMSRNLTFDRSWDVVMKFDGELQEKEDNNSVDLLKFIKRFAARKLPHWVANVKKVNFKNSLSKYQCNQFKIIPISPQQKLNLAVLQKKITRILVISPFISASTLQEVFSKCSSEGDKYLISREFELTKLGAGKLKDLNIKSYILKDALFAGENSDAGKCSDSHPINIANQDVHVKLFLIETTDQKVYLYLGSMNATSAATGNFNNPPNNYELMIQVVLFAPDCFDTIKTELIGTAENNAEAPFREFVPEQDEPQEPPQDNQQTLHNCFRDLLNLVKLSAKIEDREDNNYHLTLTINPQPKFRPDAKITLEIAPWGLDNFSHLNFETKSELKFEKINGDQISDFYRLRLSITNDDKSVDKLERVIVIPTLSPEQVAKRNTVISNNILSDSTKVFEYLQYALAVDAYSRGISLTQANRISAGNNFSPYIAGSGIYEQLLYWKVHDEQRLQDVIKIMDDLKANCSDTTDLEKLKKLCQTFVSTDKANK